MRSKPRALWCVLLDMGLAYHFSGDKQVKKVARSNLKTVDKASRPALQVIMQSRHPGKVVMESVGNIHRRHGLLSGEPKVTK